MTAKEARKIAEKACEQEVNIIKKEIQEAAKSGCTRIVRPINGATIQILENLGYSVKKIDIMGSFLQTNYEINW
jgi:hypothetical protein